jgi:mono/diheme cytochrome c family protein
MTAVEKQKLDRTLYPKPPDMRQAGTQSLTEGEIYHIIHNGIRLTEMPAWGDASRDDDSWKLVLFIRHLPQMTPQEMKEMEQFTRRVLRTAPKKKNNNNSF